MEILFYICAAAVLVLFGGVIAIFLTSTKEEKEAAGYNRYPLQPWHIGYKFKRGDHLLNVEFRKIDGSLRKFDQFVVIEVVGKCVVGWEIPDKGSPQKRSFNLDRLISCI